ncbi:MAG: hypothetical protein LLG14_03140 [Nocardiaceae bacterium]|nr:hypothetical protein [Nocardiaceae bacterium]
MGREGTGAPLSRRALFAIVAGGAATAVAGCSGAITGERIGGTPRPVAAQGFHEPVPTSTPSPGTGLSGRFPVAPPQRLKYPPLTGSPAPQNGGDLFLPQGLNELPIVVMIRGGGWRVPIGLGYMTHLPVTSHRTGWRCGTSNTGGSAEVVAGRRP